MRVCFVVTAAFWFLLGGFAPLAAASARNKPPSAPPASRFFAYRVRDDGGVAAFDVKSNGDLVPLSFAPVPPLLDDANVQRSPYFPSLLRNIKLFHHRTRPVLYAVAPSYQAETKDGKTSVHFSDYQLRVFGIGSDGHLALRQTLRVSDSPRIFNPNGTRLYVPSGDKGLDIFAVAKNGTLHKTGTSAEGGGRDSDLYFGGDGPAGGENGNEYVMTFAPSGRFAYRSHRERGLDWDTTEWETFRIDAQGLLHLDKSRPSRGPHSTFEEREPNWGKGKIVGFDPAGRFALLVAEPSASDVSTKSAPFFVTRKIGADKLRETARFGRFTVPVSQKRTVAGSVEYAASLRPDNFIDAAAVVPLAAPSSDGKTEPERFVALFRLLPDGSVKQIKAWAKPMNKESEEAVSSNYTFIEKSHLLEAAKP